MRIVLFLVLLFVPSFALAQGGIVPLCGGENQPICGACQLVELASNIINFFVYGAIVVATLMFTWAGIKYVTSGPKPDQISEAHKIFWNVIIGLVVVLGAWLIVDTILRVIPSGADREGIAPWAEVLCEPSR